MCPLLNKFIQYILLSNYAVVCVGYRFMENKCNPEI